MLMCSVATQWDLRALKLLLLYVIITCGNNNPRAVVTFFVDLTFTDDAANLQIYKIQKTQMVYS